MRSNRTLNALSILTIGSAVMLPSSSALADDPATHLEWAQLLVDTIDPADNAYGSPATVYWEGYGGHAESYNVSKCAPFVTSVIVQAYDTDYASWMGCSSPSSYTYNAAIKAGNGFTRITNIDDVQPGDIIGIYYLDAGCTSLTCGGFKTCSSSGHTAIVAGTPTARTATSPIVSDTLQYEVSVIDSSSSYHGSLDTRYKAEASGAHDSGAGQGIMRIYADATTHEIVGYTWSTYSNSTYYDLSQRDLAIGRYVAP